MFYEGKAKKLYATADPDLVIAYFKADATAFNAKKRGTIEDKGVMNNRMSEVFFTLIYPEHAVLFGWATEAELDTIHAMALKVNDVLSRFLDERGVILVDFKLEF